VRQIDLQEEMFRLIDRLNGLFFKLEQFDRMFSEKEINPKIYVESISARKNILEQIRKTLLIIQKLKGEIKTEKDLSELLQKLASTG